MSAERYIRHGTIERLSFPHDLKGPTMKVLPFPCTRPAPEVAAEVAAPPYDVFDRDEAAAYVQERPLSFVNIDRPETQFPPSQDMYAPESMRARRSFCANASPTAPISMMQHPATTSTS